MKGLKALLEPNSIAVIGASDNPKRIGGMPLKLLFDYDFKGKVFPINPKYKEVFTYTCYPEVEALPEVPDLVVLAIGAKQVLTMLERCHAKGIPAALVYAAGFAEEGGEGSKLQDELAAFCKRTGMRVAGPNCMGLANLNTKAFTAFAEIFNTTKMQTEPGKVSILTQSGNVCSALYAFCRAQNLPVSQFINTGNEVNIDFSEYLEYLANDDNTEIILGYLEQVRDGSRFIKACQILQEKNKVLILLKSGKTDKGAVAVQSHTSALAGNNKIYETVFKELNVIEAEDFDQMAQLALLSTYRDKTAGQRVGIVTMSGALGAVLSDRFIQGEMQVPDLSADTQKTLRASVPSYGMVSNPVDVTGNIVNDPQCVVDVFNALASSDSIDVIVTTAPGYLLDKMTPPLIEVVNKSNKLFVAIDTGKAQMRNELKVAGVMVFNDLGLAVRTLVPFLNWQINRQQYFNHVTSQTSGSSLIKQEINLPCDELVAREFLEDFGIPNTNVVKADSLNQLEEVFEKINLPVAMKLLSPDVMHKTEAGGVVLDVKSLEEAKKTFNNIEEQLQQYDPKARFNGVLITPMETGVAELLVGISKDPVFGPVLTVALGGVMTELYQDAAHALVPITKEKAFNLLRSLKGFPLLDGFRGKEQADLEAVAQTLVNICQAFEVIEDQVASIEVNPLLVKAKNQGVVMLDALFVPEDK